MGRKFYPANGAPARPLFEDGHYGLAVVTAQTACEVITEVALSFWFAEMTLEGSSRRWNMVAGAMLESPRPPAE
jgi:hypothetical protein